jgi:general secretion pathway protein G
MSRRGFTLVELLIVVVILGVLAAMVVPRLAGRTEQARAARAAADIQGAIPLAIDLYEVDVGKYPSSLEALRQKPADAKTWRGPYLKKPPLDPWGQAYQYHCCPGQKGGGDYDLWSLGPDGVEGGGNDVTNWGEQSKP